MYATERHEAIAAALLSAGRVSVADLADHFYLTTETVRRDLDALETAGLLLLCLAVALLFAAATWAMAASRTTPGRAANLFAHSLVPIVVGYIVAHYLSYGVEVGQQTLARLSDPLVDGSNLLGTADLQVNYWLTQHPTFLATVKVLAIVAGHVLVVLVRRI